MKNKIITAAAIALLAASCGQKEEAVAENKNDKFCIGADLKAKLSIDNVAVTPVAETIALTGNVSYNTDQVVQFSSLIDGVVTNTFFSLGDYVKKGQVLAEIKSTELNSLKAESVSLKSQLEVSKRQLASVKSMFDDGIASQSDLLKAQSDVAVLESSIGNVTQNLALFSASTEKSVFRILAPANGYVVNKNMSPGMQISAGEAPLFTISDLKEVWVMVNIYATNLKDVSEGMEVSIKTPSYPDETFKGKIDMLSQVFDAEEHVVKARIVMQNPDMKLKPGMTADIMIASKRQQGEMPAIPAKALIFDDNQNFVLVYHDDCNIEIRKIEPTVKNRDYLYFDKGLNAGEKVITKNHLLVYEQIKN